MSFPDPGIDRPRQGAPGAWLRRSLLAFAATGLLTGCGGGDPLESFDLSAAKGASIQRLPRGQLVVYEPAAIAPTDSDRLIVRPTPDTVATLKGAQWVERLPRLVQTRLVQSFENARLLRSVSRPEAKIQPDTTLSSEIRRFDIDIGANEAVVEVSVKLVAESSGRIRAARIFVVRTPGSAANGAAAAAALDEALGQVLRQIVAWTAQNL